jgi:Protein of unknown function (DUF2948)
VLRLDALDETDLTVISAQMQDAVLTLGDISYAPKRKQFALIANRYAWDAGRRERRRSGLHFNRVNSVQVQNLRKGDREAIVSLLAVTFTSTDDPSGTVTLAFSGGGSIRLAVECIEASLRDLGPAWETPSTPRHTDDTEGA